MMLWIRTIFFLFWIRIFKSSKTTMYRYGSILYGTNFIQKKILLKNFSWNYVWTDTLSKSISMYGLPTGLHKKGYYRWYASFLTTGSGIQTTQNNSYLYFTFLVILHISEGRMRETSGTQLLKSHFSSITKSPSSRKPVGETTSMSTVVLVVYAMFIHSGACRLCHVYPQWCLPFNVYSGAWRLRNR
jgi:hypothetical protein